ncbi:uncharacterized protein LOC134247779 [Saccostrea cucullata]|uniref:uncharacterized protein LOC134247779 n=1 Tax=Saccostrea cuccullata TaxID=36930 RepID=UPI002ED03DAF
MTCNSSWDGVITDKQLCIGTGDTGACRRPSMFLLFLTLETRYHCWTFDQENLLFYKSSPVSGYTALPVGTLVRRGRHWNYDDQDGGPDEIGVVIINKDGGRLVKVCWRSPLAAHELNVYRFGDQERFDIDVAESPLIDLEGLIDSGSPRWEVIDEAGKWWPLTGVSALQLEDSVALKRTILTMQEGHIQGTFRLEGDKLTDFNTHRTLRIRKLEETLELIFLEMEILRF